MSREPGSAGAPRAGVPDPARAPIFWGAMRFAHVRVRYGRPAAVDPAAALAAAWASALSARPSAAEWRPPCDVTEGASGWTVRIEIGGLADDDLEILVYEDSLVVQGERPWPGAGEAERVHLAELRYGRFRVAVELPPAVDRDAVEARYDRGILTVALPRALRGAP